MSDTKKCYRCNKIQQISTFVDTTGSANPRGQYCVSCHHERLKEQLNKALAEERDKIPKLKIMYGKYWEHYAWPNDFATTLYTEREFCPYCGGKLTDRAHIDHMDPLARGDENSIRNTV